MKNGTLKQQAHTRMTRIAQASPYFIFSAREMTALLVDDKFKSTGVVETTTHWLKTHPHFETIRTGKVLQFKYTGGATA